MSARRRCNRINRAGDSEWYVFDMKEGRSTYKRQDGSRVVSRYNIQPGPAYMKPFQMDSVAEDGTLISSRRVTYSSDGKVEKEWTENGSAPSILAGAGMRYIDLSEAEKLQKEPGTSSSTPAPPSNYAAGHIPGAIHLGRTTFELDLPQVQDALKQAKTIIVYCTSRQCEDSSIVATNCAKEDTPLSSSSKAAGPNGGRRTGDNPIARLVGPPRASLNG